MLYFCDISLSPTNFRGIHSASIAFSTVFIQIRKEDRVGKRKLVLETFRNTLGVILFKVLFHSVTANQIKYLSNLHPNCTVNSYAPYKDQEAMSFKIKASLTVLSLFEARSERFLLMHSFL